MATSEIATLLFLEYLHRNRLLIRTDGTPLLADNAMVALALLVAESEPSQKDLMVRLVLNLIDDDRGYLTRGTAYDRAS
jgi:hypothetical protein